MKNIYKEYEKAAKMISKEDTVIINRIGDAVLICNSYYLVKVHTALYDTCFRPVSFRFPALDDGDKMTSNGKKRMPEPCTCDLNRCIPDYDMLFEVAATNFIEDLQEGRLVRVFLDPDSRIISVNNDYYTALRCFNPYRDAWYGGLKKPLVSPDFRDEDNAVMILPVNTRERYFSVRG